MFYSISYPYHYPINSTLSSSMLSVALLNVDFPQIQGGPKNGNICFICQRKAVKEFALMIPHVLRFIKISLASA